MPGSQSLIGGGEIAGLTLRAWAFLTGAGALLKGQNIQSSARISSGTYELNLATAMPDGNTIVIVKRGLRVGTPGAQMAGGNTLSRVAYEISVNGTAGDDLHWVGVYG
jgi:hypothetical protein